MTRPRRPWTERDDGLLRKFHAEGKSDPDIAYIIGRHRELIYLQRKRLGLPANNRGGGTKGYRHTPEAREKLRLVLLKRWQNPAFKAKMLTKLTASRKIGNAMRFKPPPRATPEFRQYIKFVRYLGLKGAHQEMFHVKQAQSP